MATVTSIVPNLRGGIGNRMYSDEQRVAVRHAMHNGTFDNDAAKEEMRFGSNKSSTSVGSRSTENKVGTRAHIGWFGVTVANCENGDVRQSPNGIYVYDNNGREEIPVNGGRGTGMLEMREMYECLFEGKPIVHDGRWALATLEVQMAILESSREHREIQVSRQVGVRERTLA